MLDEKQLALRRTGVTGTDIARICGLSEFGSPLDVYLEKVGKAEPLDLTPALKRGLYLEDGILRWYEADSGALRIERPGTLQLRGEPRIMATPDGVAFFDQPLNTMLHTGRLPSGDVRGVEVKSPGPHMEHGWGEPGTDQVPAAYLCQAVFEMAVLDVERLDFAALLGGELRIFPVRRSRVVEGKLIERALAFWRDHVEADKPPAPTWRERDAEWVKKAFPKATKPALHWDALTPEQRLTLEEYLRTYAQASEADRACVEWESRAKMLVGEAGGVTGLPRELGFSRIDWTENASGPVAWRRVAEALKAGTSWDDAVKANTGSPARPLAPRKPKKGSE